MSAQFKNILQQAFDTSLSKDFWTQEKIIILMESSMLLKVKSTLPAYQVQFAFTQHYFSIQYQNQEKFYIALDFSINFEVILQQENALKSKKIGFKLCKKGNGQSIQLYHEDISVIQKWIKNLRTKINQLGFHRYFKAIRKLGKGQFATVFQVQNLQTGHKFAVKGFSKLNLNKTTKGWQSLINQIKIMRSFHHKNLQKLECVYETQNSIYLVTQLLRGGTLFDRLQKISKQKRKVDIQNVRQFMKGIFNGLEQLCKLQIVHRDLKLENIILRNRQSFQPVIIDFGLSTFSQEPQYLYYKCGTPGFVSPEVMNSTKQQKIQPISDMFSVGAIFHYILTQKSVFSGETTEEVLISNRKFNINFQSQIYDDIDYQAMLLLKKMMTINPKQRICINQALNHEFLNSQIKPITPVATTICQSQKFLLEQLRF